MRRENEEKPRKRWGPIGHYRNVVQGAGYSKMKARSIISPPATR
jgi:hypothetical protein